MQEQQIPENTIKLFNEFLNTRHNIVNDINYFKEQLTALITLFSGTKYQQDFQELKKILDTCPINTYKENSDAAQNFTQAIIEQHQKIYENTEFKRDFLAPLYSLSILQEKCISIQKKFKEDDLLMALAPSKKSRQAFENVKADIELKKTTEKERYVINDLKKILKTDQLKKKFEEYKQSIAKKYEDSEHGRLIIDYLKNLRTTLNDEKLEAYKSKIKNLNQDEQVAKTKEFHKKLTDETLQASQYEAAISTKVEAEAEKKYDPSYQELLKKYHEPYKSEIQKLITLNNLQQKWKIARLSPSITLFIGANTIKPTQTFPRILLLINALAKEYTIQDDTKDKLLELQNYITKLNETFNKENMDENEKLLENSLYEEIFYKQLLNLTLNLEQLDTDLLITKFAQNPAATTPAIRKLIFSNHDFKNVQVKQLLENLSKLPGDDKSHKYKIAYELFSNPNEIAELTKNKTAIHDKANKDAAAAILIKVNACFNKYKLTMNRRTHVLKQIAIDDLEREVSQNTLCDTYPKLKDVLDILIIRISDCIHINGYLPPEFTKDNFYEMLKDLSNVFDNAKKEYGFDNTSHTLQTILQGPSKTSLEGPKKLEKCSITLFANLLQIMHCYRGSDLGFQLTGRKCVNHPDKKVLTDLVIKVEKIRTGALEKNNTQDADTLLEMQLAIRQALPLISERGLRDILNDLACLYTGEPSYKITPTSQKIINTQMNHQDAENIICRSDAYVKTKEFITHQTLFFTTKEKYTEKLNKIKNNQVQSQGPALLRLSSEK